MIDCAASPKIGIPPTMVFVVSKSRSFENSYIPENPRTPKTLTFSKNRLRGAKNRSNISPVAKKFYEKTTFFFQKLCICANFFFVHMCTRIVMIKNVLEGSEVGFLKGITNWGSRKGEVKL
ncbi:hypothetical protein LXL04_020650 [Taraxacum kok-saghyz]